MEVPFPTAEHVLSRFVSWLHTHHLSCSTIKNYLAAVCHSQIALGLGDPKMGSMVQLEYIIRGAKRKSQATKRTGLPIFPAMLQGLRRAWQRHPSSRDATMLWAAAIMGFFGFLQVGEVTTPSNRFDPNCNLPHGDVRVNDNQNPKCVVVWIKASKMDPFWQGSPFTWGGQITNCAL